MRALFSILLLIISIPACAQNPDAIYRQACGPKEAMFEEQVVKGQPPKAPEPGNALVYFIQDQSGTLFTTRVGLDGSWAGVLQGDSYFFVSVAPGEHHACVATQDRKHPGARLARFTAEAGKVYYYLVRGIAGGSDLGAFAVMLFGPVDSDEALFLIASDPQSIATPKP